MDITELLNFHASDKHSQNGYGDIYEALFDRAFRDDEINLLEVGIGTVAAGAHSSMHGHDLPGYAPGASLRTWYDAFPRGAIYGIDVQDDTMAWRWPHHLSRARITTAICDSTDEIAVARTFSGWPRFDIIIDDGSHRCSDQLKTLKNLYRHMMPGGRYIIEDVSSMHVDWLMSHLPDVIGDASFFVVRLPKATMIVITAREQLFDGVDKQLVLVTSMYDMVTRGAEQHRSVDWLKTNSKFVMGLDVPMVVFTDVHLEDDVRQLRGSRPTEIITRDLDQLVAPHRVHGIFNGKLQENASRKKVTHSYVQLMWAKYGMLEYVATHVHAKNIGWIDAAITHVAQTTPGMTAESMFGQSLFTPKLWVHVLKPFHEKETRAPDYWRNVHGHLAGGLVVGDTVAMKRLCSEFWRAADLAIKHGLAPLDEGLLSYVVAQQPKGFNYSYGDYCDILTNHSQATRGADHLRWQIEQIKQEPAMADHMERIRRQLAAILPAIEPAPALRKTLGLVMIVKNEAHGIAETLASFKPYIDYWTILDTGSTDGTPDVIQAVLAGVPGELHHGAFGDFSTARNNALDLHGDKTVFTIMPDADDQLVNGQALKPVLEAFEAFEDQDAFLINLRRDPLTYHLPLVLRTAAKWRYRYRVHEICGPSDGKEGFATVAVPLVQLRQRQPERSREASKQRWERDLELLRTDYVANPRDARVLFYLAQTYECLERPVEALSVYRERVAVGGWPEETYEAQLRIAKILQTLEQRARDTTLVRTPTEVLAAQPWSAIQQLFLDLYAEHPTRAEPLFQIAIYWYEMQKHALAFTFAQRAAATPMPGAGLFIDASVYEWRAAHIASISGFYCDKLGDPTVRVIGRKLAEQCVRHSPKNENFRANWAFYAPSAAEQFAGYVDKQIGFTPPDPFVPNNPSIYIDITGDIYCIVRTTNYRIVDGQYLTLDEAGNQVPIANNPIVTRNYLLYLSPELDVERSRELIDKTGEARSSYPVHGFEDCRLFARGSRLHFTATVCDFDLTRAAEGPREIVLGRLWHDGNGYEITHAKVLHGPWSDRAQKNWMPVVKHIKQDDEPDLIVYATAPNDQRQATVLDLAQVLQQTTPAIASYDHGRLRGGSQVIYILSRDIYLAIVHDVSWPGTGRIYLHRFVQFDADFRVVAMTDPFYFKKRGIEFCAGLALQDGSKLIASFGVDDREAWFGIFDLEAVIAKLRTDFQI